MDFLTNLIGDRGSEFVSGLVDKAGFSAEQAEKFVPEATGSVVEAARSLPDLDLSDLGQATRSITEKIDVPGLARKAGVDEQLASKGLSSMLPNLLQTIQEKAGGVAGLASLLGGLKGGGVLGGLGKMFDK